MLKEDFCRKKIRSLNEEIACSKDEEYIAHLKRLKEAYEVECVKAMMREVEEYD